MIGVQPYVEIVKVPDGEAPYWVRKQWVGLKLPVVKRHNYGPFVLPIATDVKEILSGRPSSEVFRWIVNKKQAISVLEGRNTEAARWFSQNIELQGSFTFRLEEAVLVE